jgi:hypothetical protein
MIKKILFLPIVLVTCASMDIASSAAPASSTGAPGEVDCTNSGCHDTYSSNSGIGVITIIPDSSLTNYTPGQTYTITLEVSQSPLVRFGFQMVALRDSDQTNVGAFSVIDGLRNQITPGYNNLSNRRYMTYTFNSTNCLSTPGQGIWSFKWTAPSTDVGPITFYAAGIAANNDGMDFGDYCYTASLKINPSPLQSIENYTPNLNNFSLNIFPNPVKDNVNINYTLTELSKIKIDLVDPQGKIVEQLLSSKQDKGEHKLSLPIANCYKGGMYFLRFERNGKIANKKVFITD